MHTERIIVNDNNSVINIYIYTQIFNITIKTEVKLKGHIVTIFIRCKMEQSNITDRN